MAGFVTGTGELSYNGVEFPAQIRAQYRCNPVRDSAGRQTKYVAHTLTVETILHNGQSNIISGDTDITTLDADFPTIRRKLTESGGTLKFKQKGFGTNYAINTLHEDVAYGPFPEELVWEPVGDNRAVRIVWTVTVQIKECPSANTGTIAELNYDLAWSIDEAGRTTRTITGMLEASARRTAPGATSLSRTADDFRDAVQIPVPLGYTRITANFNLTADKRWLNFTFIDQELASDNPYPDGIIQPSVTYNITNTDKGFTLWNASLSGNITVGQGHPRWWAWTAFLMVVQSKIDAELQMRKRNGEQGGIVFIHLVDITEDVFGRSMTFQIAWTFQCHISALWAGTGLLKLIDGSNWASYRNSMTVPQGNWSNRGHSRLFHDTGRDMIIGLCDPGSLYYPDTPHRNTPEFFPPPFYNKECPQPEYSYLKFEVEAELVRDPSEVTHYPLVQPEQYSVPSFNSGQTGTTHAGSSLTVEPLSQRYTQSGYVVKFTGHAVRAGHAIPEVHLVEYGGQPCKPIKPQDHKHKKLAEYDCPIYLAKWERYYEIPGTPNGDVSLYEPNIDQVF